MTLDVKALRDVCAADREATSRFDAGPTRENFDAAMLAREAYLGAVPSVLVLALLDRLERAEAIVGAVEAAYYPAVGDNVERHWYRVRSLLDAMRDGHTRAALDDEAPR